MAVSAIKADPTRFQYKLAQTNHGTGEVGSLAGVKAWNPDLAGIVQVWEDPADGQTYVVNGHNRHALAARQGVDSLNVMHIRAGSAEEARAKGALTNIAEGRGTPTAAAKFFRDTGIGPDDLERTGVRLRDSTAANGLAIAKLPGPLFTRVINGEMTEAQGAIVGGAGLSEPQQMVAWKKFEADPKKTDERLREYVHDMQGDFGGLSDQAGFDFAGSDSADEQRRDLTRIDLKAHLRKNLSGAIRAFGAGSSKAVAGRLAQVEGNTLDTEANARAKQDAETALHAFNSLANRRGNPVSDAIRRGVDSILAAPTKDAADAARSAVLDELTRSAPEWIDSALLGMSGDRQRPPAPGQGSIF